MNLQKMIMSGLTDGGISQISTMLGQDTKKGTDTLNTALWFIFEGLGNNATTTKGAEAIAKAAETHDNTIIPKLQESLADGKIDLKDWAKILGHIFGNKTPVVETTIADNAGVSSNKIGNLLKTLAPIVLSAIVPNKQSDGSFDFTDLAQTLLWSSKSANSNSSLAMDAMTSILGSSSNTITKSGGGILGKLLEKLFG